MAIMSTLIMWILLLSRITIPSLSSMNSLMKCPEQPCSRVQIAEQDIIRFAWQSGGTQDRISDSSAHAPGIQSYAIGHRCTNHFSECYEHNICTTSLPLCPRVYWWHIDQRSNIVGTQRVSRCGLSDFGRKWTQSGEVQVCVSKGTTEISRSHKLCG